MRRNLNYKATALATTVAAIATGCGALSSLNTTTTTGSITISGSLNQSTGLNLKSYDRAYSRMGDEYGFLTASTSDLHAMVDLSTLSVYCVTFADPPTAGSGTVASNGNFSVDLSSAADVPFGCFVKQGSSVLATLVIEDSSEKSLDGESQTTSSVALASSANLGTISFNPTTGKAVANVANFQDKKTTTDTAVAAANFDFTGTWKMAAVNFALPDGYSAPCAAGAANCPGPQVDQSVYVKRINGKKFTPDSTCAAAATGHTFGPTDTCDGTTGTEDVYGIAVWASAAAANTACGNKLGFSYDEAKAYAQIDLTNSGIAAGDFTWHTDYAEGWKMATATTDYEIKACSDVTVGTDAIPGWKCVDNTTHTEPTYQVNLAGGCVQTGTTNPVRVVSNWPTTCDLAAHASLDGYYTQSCHGNATVVDNSGTPSTVDVTCTNTFGVFTVAGNTKLLTGTNPNSSTFFNWNNVATYLAQNGTCSTITPNTTEKELAQLKCYANYFHKQNLMNDDTKCVRKLETNWNATAPANFVIENGPQRPATQYVFEKFQYTSSTTGTFHNEELQIRGAMSGTMWMPCRILSKFTMNVTKKSDSQMLADFVQEGVLLDTGVKGCVAASSQLGVGVSRTMLYMNKQP